MKLNGLSNINIIKLDYIIMPYIVGFFYERRTWYMFMILWSTTNQSLVVCTLITVHGSLFWPSTIIHSYRKIYDKTRDRNLFVLSRHIKMLFLKRGYILLMCRNSPSYLIWNKASKELRFTVYIKFLDRNVVVFYQTCIKHCTAQ